MTVDGKSRLKTLPSKILILTATYFVIGVLTLAAEAPPVIVTAVWLPAGLALTTTLVWGYRVWPGILLGALVTQTAFHLDATSAATIFKTVVTSALIGSGAALQGIVGAYLIRRFAGFPRSLDRLQDANILLLGGPVSCLVGGVVGGTALWLAGNTADLSLVDHWWNGWLAETLGVLIILPLVSVWLAERSRISLHMRLCVILPVCLAAVLTILAFMDIRAGKWRQIEADFTRKAQIMASTLTDTFESYFDVLYSIKGLFDASVEVDRHEFQIFVQRLFERHFGIQALEWIPRVRYEQRIFYEAAARHDGFSAFQITERESQEQMVSAARRAEYFPVYYVEPYLSNELALGFDLSSNSTRRAAISRSRDTGKQTATARITLVQEQEKQYGVVVFLPVYSRKGVPDTVEARRAALRGFVLGVFRIGDMVRTALKAFDLATVMYSLYDDMAPVSKQLLWEHHPAVLPTAGGLLNRRQETYPAALRFRSTFDMGGRSWTIRFSPTAAYLAAHRSWNVWAILAGGLLFCSLLGALLLVVIGRSAELTTTNIGLQKEIVERTQAEIKVRESEARYRTLVSNLDTGVVVHASDTRILLANYRAQELLGLTEDEMLGKKDIDPAWHFLREDGSRLPQDGFPVNVVISTQKALTNFVVGIKNTKSKDIVWVIVNAFPEYGENYRLKQVVVTFWDYTQLKLAEAALAKQTNDLAQSNTELRGEIVERKLVEAELMKKQQQIAKDLEVAAGIQQSLIPSYSPLIESIRVAWYFEPCEQIGGDIFNFQYTGRNHISFYMLDVCGHGVSSALISATVTQFLQTNYDLSDNASDAVRPEAVLNSLNQFFPFERFDSFFTIVYVTLDHTNGRLSYSCAGHPSPILLHAAGELEALDGHGPVIGASGGQPFFEEEKQLQSGDKIVLYTDGVLDYSNLAGGFFGKQRFYETLHAHSHQPVQTLMDSVRKRIADFGGSANSGDDLSMMVIEYV